jgi:hypothetical protein
MLVSTDLANTDPLLSDLADNGGLTETHALASTSPAVDQGFQSLCTSLAAEDWGAFDQRGADFARTLDGDGDAVKVCDMGAFEYIRPSVPSSGSSDGGFCAYHPNGRFDPVLPAIVLIGLAYAAWRRKSA